MKKTIRTFNIICAMIAVILSLASCASTGESPSRESYTGSLVYYLNSAGTALVPYEYNLRPEETTVDGLLEQLATVPSGEGYEAPLAGITVINTIIDENGKLIVEFGREYEALKGIQELLVRAAIVRTLVMNPQISSVEFWVGGAPIVDSNSEPIGSMDRQTFVDYFGKEQDDLLSENVTIYFASLDGSGLYKETHRIYYENTLSLEQAVIKAMLNEPESTDAKVAISPNINIYNITTTDGTCYLDMNSNFFDVNGNVSQTLALNAIVNSLCEINGVRHVQINIIESTEEPNLETHLETVSGMYEMDSSVVLN